MKATLILSALILALLTGCSDNFDVTGPMNNTNGSGGQLSQGTIPGYQDPGQLLLWKLDELCVRISNEYIVENKATYTNQPFLYIADYLITFDSYTDANKRTNGFVPIVQVNKDGETVFEGSDCPEANPQGSCHREIKLEKVRFNNLTFYLALMQGDNPPINNNEAQSTLLLSDIKVYLLE